MLPMINSGKYPKEENDAINLLSQKITDLYLFKENIVNAITLFGVLKNSRDQPGFRSGWVFVPARDGAISLSHYIKVLGFIRSSFQSCPTFRSDVDTDLLKRCEKAFRECFPFAESLRHAVAHAAELVKSDSEITRHAVSDFVKGSTHIKGVGRAILRDHLDENTFTYSFEGECVYYNLNQDTVDNITKITEDVFRAFSKC